MLSIFAIGCLLAIVAVALPASAQNGKIGKFGVNIKERNVNVATTTAAEKRIAAQKDRANKEIDNRVNALNALIDRINKMARISDSNKASLKSTIQTVIANLTNLKAKIAADTDEQTLKTDLQSITKEYRVYMLVVPEMQIMAAADRIKTSADMLATVANKLQARISQLPAGTDTTSLQSSLADMNAKIADAKSQADAAIAKVSALKPDQGDKTVFQSNNQALKDARSKIQAAQKDLVAAQKDAKTIVQKIKDILKENRKATTTPESQ